MELALKQRPVTLEKPLVPAFAKNSRGVILFKSSSIVTGTGQTKDGIFLRNDGSSHQIAHATTTKVVQKEPEEDGKNSRAKDLTPQN